MLFVSRGADQKAYKFLVSADYAILLRLLLLDLQLYPLHLPVACPFPLPQL